MRKISKTRPANPERHVPRTDLVETGPPQIPGPTITAWPGSPDIDLTAFFARSPPEATIAGAITAITQRVGQSPNGTVSLSDGTRITFATAGPFDIVELI